MKFAEIKGKDKDQLNALVAEAKKEEFNLRFQRVAGESPNPSRFRAIQKTVARAKTQLTALKKQGKKG